MSLEPNAVTFESFSLHPDLLRAVRDQGFERPTQIQGMAIPPLMEGRDALGAAATGSGKTAAFLLPIMHRLLEKPRGKTRALVLAPTRELAAQIIEHFDLLARHTRLTGAAVFGGVGMQPQVDAFRRGVDLIAACPGRLLDHFQYDYARLDGLEYLVLDEADRMLDMGFLPDVKRVIEKLPTRRQTLLFSATMPGPIVQLSRQMLKDPVALNIERKSTAAKGITHAVYPVPGDLKSGLMVELLARTQFDSVLAFTRTKHRANRLADLLERKGVKCTRIHGNRSQTRRTEAMAGFKDGTFRVMVATDIAARGIDVEELALVVNFDVPHVAEDYIHRVGRTARADCTGVAITFVAPDEEDDLRGIERHMGVKLPRQRLEGFDYTRRAEERFEVPIGERIAEIRKRKSDERERGKANAARRSASAETRAGDDRRRAETRAADEQRRAGGANRPLRQSGGRPGQAVQPSAARPSGHPQPRPTHSQYPVAAQAHSRPVQPPRPAPAPHPATVSVPIAVPAQAPRQEEERPGATPGLFRWRADQRPQRR